MSECWGWLVKVIKGAGNYHVKGFINGSARRLWPRLVRHRMRQAPSCLIRHFGGGPDCPRDTKYGTHLIFAK